MPSPVICSLPSCRIQEQWAFYLVMKTVHKIRRKRKNFSIVDNTLIRREDIGFCARGILQFMLSHTEEWEMNMTMLEKRTPEPRRAIKRAVWELEACGYATRHQIKNSKNQFTGTVWTWHEEPVPLSERTKKPAGFPTDQIPGVQDWTGPFPADRKQGVYKNTSIENHLEEYIGSKEEKREEGLGWDLVEEDIRLGRS